VLEFERIIAIYEWMAGWTLRVRLIVAGLLAVPSLWLFWDDSTSGAWIGAATPAAIVLLPLLFGAWRN